VPASDTSLSPVTQLAKEEQSDNQRKAGWGKEQDRNDSLNDIEFLADATKLIAQNKGNFKKSYPTRMLADSVCMTDVEINYDFHFTKAFPHLIVRKRSSTELDVDIFERVDNTFRKIAGFSQSLIEYDGDSIYDVNGDGTKDFVMSRYGSSGCCLKAFSNVHLFQDDERAFIEGIEFINPTFSPREKIVRGICYGNTGDTDLYKLKWIGNTLDTVEYVYYQTDKNNNRTGKVVIANGRQFWEKHKVLRVLDAVPSEYKKINGFDWFNGIL